MTAVSIVIPTFNRAAWVRGAIDSVLGQDHEDLEVIVVDDGSEDDTADVLSGYVSAHPSRFRALRQANAGQAAAINRGWAEARGEYVGYLSDDDRLLPGAVTRLARELETAPSAAIAYPGYRVVDADGEVIDTIRPIEYSPRAALRMHDTIIGPGALIRKTAIVDGGGWQPEFRWMGDFVLWMMLARHGHAIRVCEPLALWRRHEGAATTHANLDHAREHLLVFDRAVEILGDSATVADRAEGLRNACLLGYFFSGPEVRRSGHEPMAIDLQRPEISAFGAGLGLMEMPDERADEAARLWRILAAKTIELLDLRRKTPPRTPLGLAHAQRLLAELDALDDETRLSRQAETMLEAAFHCNADLDPEANRYLLVDRAGLDAAEEDELVRLAIRSTIDDLLRVIASRDELIAAARGRT